MEVGEFIPSGESDDEIWSVIWLLTFVPSFSIGLIEARLMLPLVSKRFRRQEIKPLQVAFLRLVSSNDPWDCQSIWMNMTETTRGKQGDYILGMDVSEPVTLRICYCIGGRGFHTINYHITGLFESSQSSIRRFESSQGPFRGFELNYPHVLNFGYIWTMEWGSGGKDWQKVKKIKWGIAGKAIAHFLVEGPQLVHQGKVSNLQKEIRKCFSNPEERLHQLFLSKDDPPEPPFYPD